MAYAILGSANYLHHFSGAGTVRRQLARWLTQIEEACRHPDWIDRWEEADWPIAAGTFAMAGEILDRDEIKDFAEALAAQLCEETKQGALFFKRGENPDEEELPVTAATFIEALSAVFLSGRAPGLIDPIRAAADWFLGTNRAGLSLHDFSSAGCHDALTAAGLNLNLASKRPPTFSSPFSPCTGSL